MAADFADALDREFEKAIIHFGEGRLNPSTIACVIAEAEKKLADRADRRCLLGNSPQQAATSDQLQPDVLPQPSHR
ncbi:hypothetical protein OG205_21755 [Lentzea sp. NBC_00516]|uniref:hypothetical protein n=1 Tax=Lentzea sp. NBC_00516 TaxID=2903582 RepID=UPI002E814F61|nr:hypothetical protein [Lentzea sp. NBC_00516]WUD29540.1 hypothetical protein OG205_21755 [Lentzea sp. NBC_00516]